MHRSEDSSSLLRWYLGESWGLTKVIKKSEILKMDGTVPDLWVCGAVSGCWV